MRSFAVAALLACCACPKKPAPAPDAGSPLEAFATALQTELQRRFPDDQFERDLEYGRLKWHHDGGTSVTVNLEGYFSDWSAGLDMARTADRASSWLDDQPAPILPGLRQRITVELVGRLERGKGRIGRAPYLPLGETLAIALLRDRGESMTYVTADDLSTIGVTLEEALAAAKLGLLERPAPELEELPGGVWSFHGDDWTTAYFVLGNLADGLRVKGAPLAAFVSRTRVLITGDADEAGKQALIDGALHFAEEPRSFAVRVLRLERGTGQWADYLPPGNSEIAARFRLFHDDGLVGDYETQREDLEEYAYRLPEDAAIESDADAYPAKQLVTEHEGVRSRLIVLVEPGEASLPEADVIVLHRELADGGTQVIGWVQWKRFMDVMKPRRIDVWPPRWRVVEFPTPAQLKRLALHPTLDDLP